MINTESLRVSILRDLSKTAHATDTGFMFNIIILALEGGQREPSYMKLGLSVSCLAAGVGNTGYHLNPSSPGPSPSPLQSFPIVQSDMLVGTEQLLVGTAEVQ